jgi:hypothetical protein
VQTVCSQHNLEPSCHRTKRFFLFKLHKLKRVDSLREDWILSSLIHFLTSQCRTGRELNREVGCNTLFIIQDDRLAFSVAQSTVLSRPDCPSPLSHLSPNRGTWNLENLGQFQSGGLKTHIHTFRLSLFPLSASPYPSLPSFQTLPLSPPPSHQIPTQRTLFCWENRVSFLLT